MAHFIDLEQQASASVKMNPDRALLALTILASTEVYQYSSIHSMLVMVLCQLSCASLPEVDDQLTHAIQRAALTMNLSICNLQDDLALQTSSLTVEQKAKIAAHGEHAEEMLKAVGCNDPLWLEAVKRHHEAMPGPLALRTPAERAARLIQRADLFAARISPRKARPGMSAAVAAQVAFMGEDGKPDEAGAALIKAIGIYPPGCWVGLGNGELAVAVKRGNKAHCPLVVSLVGREGMPLASPRVRNTASEGYGIRASLPSNKVKFHPDLAALLSLCQ